MKLTGYWLLVTGFNVYLSKISSYGLQNCVLIFRYKSQHPEKFKEENAKVLIYCVLSFSLFFQL